MSGLLGDAAHYQLSNYPALVTILDSRKKLCRIMVHPLTLTSHQSVLIHQTSEHF